MASKIEMKRQDLIELYQLLNVYSQTYKDSDADTERLIRKVEMRFKKIYKDDISQSGNPRNAGRKRVYTEEENLKIIELRNKGYSLRKIAQEEGCSLGRVQDVLKDNGVC